MDMVIAIDPKRTRPVVLHGGRAIGEVSFAQGHAEMLFDESAGAVERDACSGWLAGLQPEIVANLYQLWYDLPGPHLFREAQAVVARMDPGSYRQLHLGFGADVRQGWLNIDYFPVSRRVYLSDRHSLNIDLRLSLPLPDSAVENIYSCHFLEHLSFQHGCNLLKECYRVLKPGGIIRTMLPDYPKLFRNYLSRDAQFFEACVQELHVLDDMPPWQRCYADLVSQGVYESYTHKYIYDPENFSALLRGCGFSRVEEVGYDPTIDNPDPLRRDHSFVVQAAR